MIKDTENIPNEIRGQLTKVLSHIAFIGFSNCEIGITPNIEIKPSTDPILEHLRTTKPRGLGSVIFAFQLKLIQLQEYEYKINPEYKRDTWELLLSYSEMFAFEMVKNKLTHPLKLAA